MVISRRKFWLSSRNMFAERLAEERLHRAENELRTLKARAHRAASALESRRQRNHWRESIEQMLQGGPDAGHQ